MVKWIVKKGKLQHNGKKYVAGDTFEMLVKEAGNLPHGKIERVQEPATTPEAEGGGIPAFEEVQPEPVQKEEPDATKG
jgi:hypothetical protein